MVKLKKGEMYRIDSLYDLSILLNDNGVEGLDRDNLIFEYTIEDNETDGDIFLFCGEVNAGVEPDTYYAILSEDDLNGDEEDVTPCDNCDELYDDDDIYTDIGLDLLEEDEDIFDFIGYEFMGSKITIKTDSKITDEQLEQIEAILA